MRNFQHILVTLFLLFFFNARLLAQSKVEVKETTTTPAAPASPVETETHSEDKVDKGGLFVEPFLTYERGEVVVDYPAPFSSSNEDVEGFGIGARFGFHVHEIIFLALDARYSMPSYDSSMLGGDSNSKSYNLGATIGVQTPVAGLRVWGTYIAAGELDPESISNVDIKFSNLQGYRIGAGIYVSKISLNLEYQNAEYDKSTVQSIGPITGGDLGNIDAELETWIVSVSFPIAL